FGPMNSPEDARRKEEDRGRDFWVPLHKLFDGKECLRDLDLAVTLEARHVNEKLRRLHINWDRAAGWTEPALQEEPFIMKDDVIARLSSRAADGRGLLLPTPHPLVEEAVYKGRAVTFKVPRRAEVLSSSLYV